MSNTKLYSGYERTNRVKLEEKAPKLDPKDPVQGAVMARVIKDINQGEFESIGNLQQVAGAFTTAGNEAKVLVGRETVTELKGPNGEAAECNDADTLRTLMYQGYTIISTSIVDIMR